MIETIIIAVLIIECLIVGTSWYHKTYFNWVACPHCEAMMEVRRKSKRFDGKWAWQGKCELCYNYVTKHKA